MEKKNLRKQFLDIRNKIERNSAEAVFLAVKNNEFYRSAKKVFCYVSAGSEPDTFLLMEEILRAGKKLFVPKCLDKKGNMAAVEIKSLADLEVGTFGILEPEKKSGVDKKELDLCIVPGLSFDKEGFRLGYGGGYYDRFLENEEIYSIGLCFKECKAEKLPREEKDISVNEVVYI